MEVTNDESIEKAMKKVKRCKKKTIFTNFIMFLQTSSELSAAGESGINLLINNAAIMDHTPDTGLEQAKRDSYNRHFDVNVTSQVMVIKVGVISQIVVVTGSGTYV